MKIRAINLDVNYPSVKWSDSSSVPLSSVSEGFILEYIDEKKEKIKEAEELGKLKIDIKKELNNIKAIEIYLQKKKEKLEKREKSMKITEQQKENLRVITNTNFNIFIKEGKITLTTFESPSEENERLNGYSIDPESGRSEENERYEFIPNTMTFNEKTNERILELLKKIKENNERFIDFEMTGQGRLSVEEREEFISVTKEFNDLIKIKDKKKKKKMKM